MSDTDPICTDCGQPISYGESRLNMRIVGTDASRETRTATHLRCPAVTAPTPDPGAEARHKVQGWATGEAPLSEGDAADLILDLADRLSSAEAELAALRASLTWALEHGAKAQTGYVHHHGILEVEWDHTIDTDLPHCGGHIEVPCASEADIGTALLAALTQARQG